jgi:nucleoside-diphosphate-sugar epimerase
MVTCVLRPAAIYGVDEQRHLPRIVKMVDLGLNMRIGRAVVDWVHVKNLVLAILLAHDRTASLDGNCKAAPAGRAYFISDDDPIDNFQFLRPVIEVRGKSYPSLVLPVWLCLSLAWLMELVYMLTGIGPLLTRAEVVKVGVTHTFSIARAKRELGYRPLCSSREGAREMAGGTCTNSFNVRFLSSLLCQLSTTIALT